MTRESAYDKGRRYLVEGRVVIQAVDQSTIVAVVRGDSGGIYRVSHRPGMWLCDCAARGRCSHLTAVMLVTSPVRAVVVHEHTDVERAR